MQPRKKKLVRPDLQFRFVLVALAVASAVLLFNFQFVRFLLGGVPALFPGVPSAAAVVQGCQESVTYALALSVATAIPLAAGLGILFSFPFAGPCYRFSRFFAGLRDGRWDTRCQLRKGDELQDIAREINSALDVVRAGMKQDRGLLEDAAAFLESGALRPGDEDDAKVNAWRARVKEAIAFHERRLPTIGGTKPVVTPERQSETQSG